MKNLHRTHIMPTYYIGLPRPIHPPALPDPYKRRVMFNGVAGIHEEVAHRRPDKHDRNDHYRTIGEVSEPLS